MFTYYCHMNWVDRAAAYHRFQDYDDVGTFAQRSPSSVQGGPMRRNLLWILIRYTDSTKNKLKTNPVEQRHGPESTKQNISVQKMTESSPIQIFVSLLYIVSWRPFSGCFFSAYGSFTTMYLYDWRLLETKHPCIFVQRIFFEFGHPCTVCLHNGRGWTAHHRCQDCHIPTHQ
jgi:hypothetical protein